MTYSKVPPASSFVRGSKRSRPYEHKAMLGSMPGGYSLSLAQAAPLAPAPQKSKWMILIAVVIVIAIIYWMTRGKSKSVKTIKKASTKELAKNLYRRLENRPRRSSALMASLAQHARDD